MMPDRSQRTSGVATAAARTDTAVERMVYLPGDTSEDPPSGWTPFEALLTDEQEEPRVALASDDMAQIIYTAGPSRAPREPC